MENETVVPISKDPDAAFKEGIRFAAERFVAALSDPATHAWCAKILFAKLAEERGIAFSSSPSRLQPKIAELCEILEAFYKRELEQSDL